LLVNQPKLCGDFEEKKGLVSFNEGKTITIGYPGTMVSSVIKKGRRRRRGDHLRSPKDRDRL